IVVQDEIEISTTIIIRFTRVPCKRVFIQGGVLNKESTTLQNGIGHARGPFYVDSVKDTITVGVGGFAFHLYYGGMQRTDEASEPDGTMHFLLRMHKTQFFLV